MPRPLDTLRFLLVALVLCSWTLDAGRNDNTMARAASVASLVDRGTLEITPLHQLTGDKSLVDGRYYSDKAPLPTFFVLPFHWLTVHLGLVRPGTYGTLTPGLLRLGGFLCGSLPLAILCTLLWRALRKQGRHGPWPPSTLALLALLGSFLFVYSGSFYNHLPGTLFAVLAAGAMSRDRAVYVGLYAGAAFLCDAALLLFVPIWCMQAWARGGARAALRMVVGLVPSLLLAAAHNTAVTGSPLSFPSAYSANYTVMHQQYGFGTWQPKAFLGMLFTDYRGLFFYAPVLVLGLVPLLTKFDPWRLMRDPYIAPAVVLTATFLTHATWWGGWTYGPRYVMASAGMLLFAVVLRLRDRPLERWSFLVLALFGLACAWAARATTGYSLPTEVLHPFGTLVLPRLQADAWSDWAWLREAGFSDRAAHLLFFPVLYVSIRFLALHDRRNHAPVPLS